MRSREERSSVSESRRVEGKGMNRKERKEKRGTATSNVGKKKVGNRVAAESHDRFTERTGRRRRLLAPARRALYNLTTI
jgi:hypothetical protein